MEVVIVILSFSLTVAITMARHYYKENKYLRGQINDRETKLFNLINERSGIPGREID